MGKAFSAFWACAWCGLPFKPEARQGNPIKIHTCYRPACQERLRLYFLLKDDNNKLFHFIKTIELKNNGEAERKD